MGTNFKENELIVKFEKLKSKEIAECELNLTKREIEWVLISLKLTHTYGDLLDSALGLNCEPKSPEAIVDTISIKNTMRS